MLFSGFRDRLGAWPNSLMSNVPDNEFDLEKLFLPAWAQETSSVTKYAKYEGEEERPERRGDRGDARRRRPGEGRRPEGQRRGPGSPVERPGRPGGGRERPHRGRGDRRGPRPDENRERREPLPLPELSLSLVPEEAGVESLSRQIKMAGRAYPLFDIAQMILQKPERYKVAFNTKKNPDGKAIQPLFVCALDDTLWLSEDEAVGHVLNKHFSTFYQADRTATEPPKGKYTFVAQCGMSGVILGPPNHHDYQNQLRKLHAERFSRMPFETYKSRVKIVRDEEVVKKWVEEQSWKTEYVCLNMPEPLRLGDRGAVEKHFRENHKDNIIKQTESHTLSGSAARALRSPGLVRLVRQVWEDQRHFPLQIATVLSQQFASHGLQFFKVNRTITHVCVARPHYLDLAVIPVSDGVKRIVDFINGKPKCSRRQLVEALAPSPAPAPIPVATEGQPAVAPEPSPPTSEQTSVIADLHWLIHQGHVIEFANGVLECAKKPVPKPPKPAAKPEQASAAAAQPETAAPVESSAESVTAVPPELAPEASATSTMEPSPEAIPSATDSTAVEPSTPAEASSSPAVPEAARAESQGPVDRLPEVANLVHTPVNSVGSAS